MADVVDLEEEPEPPNNAQPPSSPEVQFVRATVRPPEAPPRGRGFMGQSNLLDMIRLRPSRLSSVDATSREEAFRQEVALRARNLARRPQHGVDTFWIGDAPNEGIDLTIDLDVDVPLGMDYQIAGFTMDNAARPVSSYKPPSPTPEGFTRTAKEDDIVVCPNCEDELGTGDEIKQQIWVAKPCGHVRIPSFWSDSPFSLYFPRFIAASVPRIAHYRKLRKRLNYPKQRRSLSRNARLLTVESQSARRKQCFRSICEPSSTATALSNWNSAFLSMASVFWGLFLGSTKQRRIWPSCFSVDIFDTLIVSDLL